METHEKIRLMRELNKWSQEDMAEKLAMSAGGYAKIERGETQLKYPAFGAVGSDFQNRYVGLAQIGRWWDGVSD